MRFTMRTVQGYVVKGHAGETHILTHIDPATMAVENIGLELGDNVEIVLPGESAPSPATVVGFWSSVE